MMVDVSYVVAGAFAGLAVGMTGVGGGALMTPILVLLLGVNPTTAIATDLWYAAITKLVAAMIHGGPNQIDWQVVRRLWSGSIPIALATVVAVSMSTSLQKVEWLTQAIGVVVLVTAVGLLTAPWLSRKARARRVADPVRFKAWQPALTVAAGALLGVCVALTSVGAGALGSVFLLFLYPLRMTPHRLVATDIVHAIPLAVLCGLGYLMAGMVDGKMLFSLLLGSLPAVAIGSLIAVRVPGRWLQIGLGCVLSAAAAKTLGLV